MAARARWMRSFEESRGKVVQASPPRQPLMRGTGRFEINVLNSRVREGFAEALGPRPFCRADSEEHDLHLHDECRRIRDNTVVRCFGIEPTPAARAPAVTAPISELGPVH